MVWNATMHMAGEIMKGSYALRVLVLQCHTYVLSLSILTRSLARTHARTHTHTHRVILWTSFYMSRCMIHWLLLYIIIKCTKGCIAL